MPASETPCAGVRQFHSPDHRPAIRVVHGLPGPRAGDLHELHAEIEEGPLVIQRPAVGDQLGSNHVAAEQAALSTLVFAAAKRDLVAGFAASQFDSQLRRAILWEAIEEDARGRLQDRNGGEPLVDFHGRPVLKCKVSRRRCRHASGFPGVVRRNPRFSTPAVDGES